MAPRPTALAAWITDEARDRGLILAGGAARELADRLGARVTEGDVDRRYLSRIASGELDKLELRHAVDEGPVTPEDVRALVAETTPASVWALSDAVGERRVDVATADARSTPRGSTPEPVILAVLHRRIVELLEIGDRLSGGLNLPEAARAMGINSEFRAKTLASQARKWTITELAAALTSPRDARRDGQERRRLRVGRAPSVDWRSCFGCDRATPGQGSPGGVGGRIGPV